MLLTKWMVREKCVAGRTFYECYRKSDMNGRQIEDHTYGGYWETRKEAEDLCGRLNARDKGFGIKVTT